MRLEPWPHDPDTAQIVVLDPDVVPTVDELAEWAATARAGGHRRLRSSALTAAAADRAHRAGFVTIDTLALLRADHGTIRSAPRPAVRTRPLRPHHHARAAEVDRAAFGDPWGNDAESFGRIRHATPVHHSRRIDVDGAVAAVAVAGSGGTTGYVQRIAVDPRHHRRGLATALVLDALGWMRRRGLTSAFVNTSVDNTAALALYRSLGFHLLDDRLTIAELDLRSVDGPVRQADAP
jgi:ribosomal protein S18 acetylase RimI-like enzyme